MIFRSPYPDITVPDVPLHHLVLQRATGLGDKPALIDGPSGRTLTYGQLARGVERVAAALGARGFGTGDVLGLFMPNCPEFALAFYGALAAGGVVTTVNSLGTEQDVEYQLRNAAAQLLVTVAPFLDRAAPAARSAGVTEVIALGAAAGTTLVTMPKFEVEPFLALLQGQRITRAFVVPPLVLALARHPAVDGYDLSCLRAMMSGAAPLEAALETACARRVGCAFIQGYGLTEASPVTHANSDEPGKARAGTVGQLLPSTECRVVDVVSGEDLGPNQDGELLIRGPQVMRGYLNDAEATAATLDADGWLHTGDIGHADADGYF